jgi:hypothetical protein
MTVRETQCLPAAFPASPHSCKGSWMYTWGLCHCDTSDCGRRRSHLPCASRPWNCIPDDFSLQRRKPSQQLQNHLTSKSALPQPFFTRCFHNHADMICTPCWKHQCLQDAPHTCVSVSTRFSVQKCRAVYFAKLPLTLANWGRSKESPESPSSRIVPGSGF